MLRTRNIQRWRSLPIDPCMQVSIMDPLPEVRAAGNLELPGFSVDKQSPFEEGSRKFSWESLFKGTAIDFDSMYLAIGGDEFDL